MTEEIGLISLLLTFSGGAIAYIKKMHDRAMKSAFDSFDNERKLYEERIAELRDDKEKAEKSFDAIRQETMNFINSVNYVPRK